MKLKRIISNLLIVFGAMTKRRAFCGPGEVFIDVSGFCTTNCIMCPAFSSMVEERPKRSKDPFLDIALFKKTVKDIKRISTQKIIVRGYGEPLFHPQIFEMIDIINNSGMDCLLFTSGFPMTESMAKIFSKKKLDIILNYLE